MSGVIRRELHFGARVVRCYADRPDNANALVREAARRTPAAEALVQGDRRLTWKQVDAQAAFIAGGLARRRVAPGDRVAILLPNSIEFVLALFGSIRLGAVAVPISMRLSPPEVAHILTDSEAKVLICGGERRDAAASNLMRIVVGGAGADDFDRLLEPREAPAVVIAEDDPFAIVYTSGTTGRPKGAIQTHLGIVHATMQFEQCWSLGPAERTILAAPASHSTGIGAVIMTMAKVGGCIVVVERFKADAFLSLAARERMTYSAMAPAMYNLCLLDPDFGRHDLSAWRVAGYGAAPMTTAAIEELGRRLPRLALVNAYGATETTAPPLLMPLGATGEHPDSVGKVVPCAEVMVVDEAGRELPHGEAGEVWMRGPTIIPRYWRNAEADEESFREGWWRSGDVGVFDEHGFLKIVDRMKDMINRGGYKVFSAEVEDVLASHPAVVECAVVGRPDPVLGERAHGFVVVSCQTRAEDILAWCAGRLADYKVPDVLTVVEGPLPRNASGKLMKNALRRLAAQNHRA